MFCFLPVNKHTFVHLYVHAYTAQLAAGVYLYYASVSKLYDNVQQVYDYAN